MNYIKHLTGFFDKVAKDKMLNPTHVSLYIALFQFWNINRFRNPISISRDEIMRISKISSMATYHKCLKNLHALGYIKYEPSFNPYKGSHVYLFNFAEDLKPNQKKDKTTSNFEHVDEQVINKLCNSDETGIEQVNEIALVPYINNTNSTNNLKDSNSLNLDEQAKKNEEHNSIFKNFEIKEKEKSSAEKEKEMPEELPSKEPGTSSPAFADYNAEHTANGRQKSSAKKEKEELPNPTIEEVLQYFRDKNYPEVEANKFFNYFKSIGWVVGGKIPMTDWPAAARNWMLNVPKFINHGRTDSAKQFDTSAGKDYSEPL